MENFAVQKSRTVVISLDDMCSFFGSAWLACDVANVIHYYYICLAAKVVCKGQIISISELAAYHVKNLGTT
jgi:hypothetical protein